jgi:DNA polymerase-2
MSILTAWLFDVYPSAEGITLWFIDRNGRSHRCMARFTPSFYLYLNENDRKRMPVLSKRCPVPIAWQMTSRNELFSGQSLDVVRIAVHNPMRFREAVWYFEQFFPPFVFYDCDILPAQLFLYDKDLFVLAYGDYEIDANGFLINWTLLDSRGAVEYELPPLSTMYIRNALDFLPPKYQHVIQLELSYDGASYAIETSDPVELLNLFNWHLHRFDPDILMTEYGDATILPKITELARTYKVPLLLNRDNGAGYTVKKESSFFQYGKVIHKDGAFELAGRWHVDSHNSFTVQESQLDGLFELTRITQMPPQRQARASIGTGLSSLQLAWAHRNKYLIPSKKREPEEFKSASTLMLADRGGLTFSPPVGYHEEVAELDFASMYPTIMVKYNVSPETINCRCCNNRRVPELEYTICEKREGIVPATLRTIVEKRAYYKHKKKEYKGRDAALYRRYDARQSALKWMLVSCFGYLGYKNARFGKIEAHESVNAFSRDTILTAKEIAERAGFTMLHAIIDCMWLKKPGATEDDFRQLANAVTREVGMEISLEGVYHWICFPASKTTPAISTTNHYFGRYTHGEYKIRGIEARRHDTPKFIKELQVRLLEEMSQAKTIEELRATVPALLDIAGEHIALLKSGRANPMDLVLRRRISQEADEYANNSISAVVTRLIEQAGVHLMAGESIEFIILDQSGKRKPEKAKPVALYALEDGYDIDQYVELTIRSLETLLLPLGWDYDMLKERFAPSAKKRLVRNFLRRVNPVEQFELLWKS